MCLHFKIIFLTDFPAKRELSTFNFVMVASFNSWDTKLHVINRIAETLMNKGFQRIAKKYKKRNKPSNCFVFVDELKK